jgi:hypothetical protein
MDVSSSEMRIFRQGQGNQGLARRRGHAEGVTQAIPQIDAEIGGIDHLWMETSYGNCI